MKPKKNFGWAAAKATHANGRMDRDCLMKAGGGNENQKLHCEMKTMQRQDVPKRAVLIQILEQDIGQKTKIKEKPTWWTDYSFLLHVSDIRLFVVNSHRTGIIRRS